MCQEFVSSELIPASCTLFSQKLVSHCVSSPLASDHFPTLSLVDYFFLVSFFKQTFCLKFSKKHILIIELLERKKRNSYQEENTVNSL